MDLPISLYLNAEIDSTSYPAGYQLLLASVKAGIVEELIYRFFFVSLFVWVGGYFKRDHEGRPTNGVHWLAILLIGLIFGWAHVDAMLAIPGVPFSALAGNMILSTILGICFGWLFWKLGLGWSIFAHFAYDALVGVVLLPIYQLSNILVWAVFLCLAILAVGISWRTLKQYGH